MDAVSRDALTETEQVLKDLAGFLHAVKDAPEGGSDPALDETAVQIMGLATRLKSFVLGDAGQHLKSQSAGRKCRAGTDVGSRSAVSNELKRSHSDESTTEGSPATA